MHLFEALDQTTQDEIVKWIGTEELGTEAQKLRLKPGNRSKCGERNSTIRNKERSRFIAFSPPVIISRSGSRNIEYLLEYSEIGGLHCPTC